MLFESGALETVEGVGYTLSTADHALVLVITERKLVTDAGKGGRADVQVTDRTVPTEHEIRVISSHFFLSQLSV
jgi:hypothetical protein